MPRITVTFAALVALLISSCPLRAAAPSAAGPELSTKDLPKIPPTEPAQALRTFQIRPGFNMQLVAAEPLVADPIAASFDENGRLFVVEMRDYSERRDERLGRIRLLEDTNDDGQFDQSTVFADRLPWPTAVICYGGGVFVGATPDILFLKDNNQDGVADVREVVFTGFGAGVERLNVQQLLNTFTWGLDNRIHGATAANSGRITSPKNPSTPPLDLRGRDFSFDPRTFEIRAETGGGQHGMSFDDRARKFVCSNSAHLQMVIYEETFAGLNPLFAMPSPLIHIAADGPAAEVFRISPDEPWRVIRTRWRVAGLVPGPIEGGGRPSGYFTGATGVTIYRGDAFPEEFYGDAFIADCGSNLIHRKKLFPDGVAMIGRRPSDETNREFVASTDNWFRPVQFANAPDGTLYVLDMYREIIEHPWSLPESIKKHLDLNSGNERGRIYRIVPTGYKHRSKPNLGSASAADLVALLQHKNAWHRETAARLLFERQDQSARSSLETLAVKSASASARLQALYVLRGLNALPDPLLHRALVDPDEAVREHAVLLAAPRLSASDSELARSYFGRANDPAPRVRYRLALTLGLVEHPNHIPALSTLAIADLDDPWIRAAVLNAVKTDAQTLLESLVTPVEPATVLARSENGSRFIRELARMAVVQAGPSASTRLLNLLDKPPSQALAFALAAALAESNLPKAAVSAPEAGAVLKRLTQDAVLAAQDSGQPVNIRLNAIELLASTAPNSEPVLFSLLKADQPDSIQLAALSELLKLGKPTGLSHLIKIWKELTPRLRAELLNGLLARPERILQLLEAIEENVIQRSELTLNQIALLRTHRVAAIQEKAMRLFSASSASSSEELWNRFRPALTARGNIQNGQKLFVERCSSCHKLNQEGFAVGPDLSSAKASGKEKLLSSILDPNREVPANYLQFMVETKDEESWTGLIASESATAITLRQAFGQERTILRKDIRKVQSLSQSMMPQGLEASLTPQDMADLLDFLVR